MPGRPNVQSPGVTDELVPSAARTANGDSGPQAGYGASSMLRAQLDVTAASGTTPNLTAFIEDTLDGANWNVVGTFTAKTAAGREVINVAGGFTDTLRVRWVITGTTPSFTFSVKVYNE